MALPLDHVPCRSVYPSRMTLPTSSRLRETLILAMRGRAEEKLDVHIAIRAEVPGAEESWDDYDETYAWLDWEEAEGRNRKCAWTVRSGTTGYRSENYFGVTETNDGRREHNSYCLKEATEKGKYVHDRSVLGQEGTYHFRMRIQWKTIPHRSGRLGGRC